MSVLSTIVVVVPVPLVEVVVTVSDSITSVTPGVQRPTVLEGQDSSALEEEEGNTEKQSDDANSDTNDVEIYKCIRLFIYCS